MKWLKIVIDIALALLPGLALKKTKNLESDLLIATKTIKILMNSKDTAEIKNMVEQSVSSLSSYNGFKKRFVKKMKKSKERLYKKLFS